MTNQRTNVKLQRDVIQFEANNIVSNPQNNNNVNHSSSNQYCYRLVEKALHLELVLNEPEIDLWLLRELALTEGGLVNDAIRRQAWPKLVGLHSKFWDDVDTTVGLFQHHQQHDQKQHGACNRHPGKTTNVDSTAKRKRSKKRKNVESHNNSFSASSSTMNSTMDSQEIRVGLRSNKHSLLDLIHENDENEHSSTNPIPNHAGNTTSDVDNDAATESPSLHSNNAASATGSSVNGQSSTNKCDESLSSETETPMQQTPVTPEYRNNETMIMKIKSHDSFQIDLDCKRCTWHLLTGSQRSQRIQMEHKHNSQIAKLIKRKQMRLSNLINYAIMTSYDDYTTIELNEDDPNWKKTATSIPDLNSFQLQQYQQQRLTYYQGYHDVACIILSTLSGSIPIKVLDNKRSTATSTIISSVHVPSEHSYFSHIAIDEFAKSCGIDLPACVLYQLSQSHFADCLKSNFWDLQTMLRLSLFPLINHFDPVVFEHFKLCDMELPYFAIPWVITWFSHEIRDTELVKRIFDFFIVSHPIMPVYVSVAMILHPINRNEILSSEYDFTALHQILASLPRNSSMVGWKYRPGDGYVSDDEQDGDEDGKGEIDDSVSIDADSFVMINEAWASLLRDDATKNNCEAVSVVSSSLSSIVDTVVPFQELMDTAISYMEKVPPRMLLRLAIRHYSCKELLEIVQPLAQHHQLKNSPSVETISKDPLSVLTDVTYNIRMLRPTFWARISKCPSNEILRNRANQVEYSDTSKITEFGGTLRRRNVGAREDATTSKQRTVRNSECISTEEEDDEDLGRYLEEKSTLARIAAGFGSDPDDKNRILAQKRKINIGIAIAVVVAAVVVSVVVKQRKTED